ncbi:hypothetical protein GO003_000040 [Methylicorpusculum oleiharenae]|uniref:hypothetical protein n=1 Tax=Methylicorpusculum oleiharenae TaxID=1338687 RepID=UPI00135907D9|nr:hypothetical protein [Methylicorpusculum oleiharenae]MCD2448793.1 hypothetical protein [Methylicorpusculum oleiharenae]
MNYQNKYMLTLITAWSFINPAGAADDKSEPAYSVVGEVTAGENKLGVAPGEQIFTDFMLDPSLIATEALSSRERLIFIDPWRWHWRRWDWLRGFVIEIPRIPGPGPEPFVLRVQAVYDDAQDMIMEMDGVPPLEKGSSFITELSFPTDSAFLKEQRLPNMDEINNGFIKGSFRVEDPQGEVLFKGSVDGLKATPAEPVCKGDVDGDGDVDTRDTRTIRLEFGRRDCPLM